MPKPITAARKLSPNVSAAPKAAPVMSVDTLNALPIQMTVSGHRPRRSDSSTCMLSASKLMTSDSDDMMVPFLSIALPIADEGRSELPQVVILDSPAFSPMPAFPRILTSKHPRAAFPRDASHARPNMLEMFRHPCDCRQFSTAKRQCVCPGKYACLRILKVG